VRAEASLIRRYRQWLTHIVALALLAAQFGMAVHASAHLGADQDAPAAQVCDYCLTSNSLQSMVGGAVATPVVVDVARQCPQKTVVRQEAPKRSFTGFRSRAPPTLL
jgi:hypothetical protein